MAIVFNCPECGRTIHAPDNGAGKRGRCPGCGGTIVVPADDSPYGADDIYEAETLPPSEGERRVSSSFDQVADDSRYDRNDDHLYDAEEVRDRREPEESRPRRRRAPSYDDEEMYDDEKQCPACGEMIRATARRCRYCGEDFEEVGRRRPRRRGRRRRSSSDGSAMTMAILSIVFALCCPIIGGILGIIGLTKANAAEADGDTTAGTAKVLSIIGIVIAVLNFFAGIMLQLNDFGGDF